MTLAFVFPGQGSQSVGMLAALAGAEPRVLQTFAEASAILGYDLWALCQQGPDGELARTEVTQPAMLAAGVACYRAWRAHGGTVPVAMAGHSLGEYTALVCSGALEFPAAVALVQERGRLMQAAVPPGSGAMAAVLGLEDAEVLAACAEAAQGEVVEAVNFNSPGQVVIAGQAGAVARAIEAAKARGAKRAVNLPVSVPSHCALMRDAALQLGERLAATALRMPEIPDVYAADATRHESVDGIRRSLQAQLHSPVRWSDIVRALLARGANVVVECGPGKVLTSLNRRIERRPDLALLALDDPSTLQQALKAAGEPIHG